LGRIVTLPKFLAGNEEKAFTGSFKQLAKHAEGKDKIADLFEPAKPKA